MAHLNTLVGGRITTLRPMLEHYIRLGIDSVQINVHLSSRTDPVLDQVRAITDSLGVQIASIKVGDWQTLITDVYAESRIRYPNDWHIVADQDEFHVYPADLRFIERLCSQNGYDYVSGCFIDRLSADGRLADLSRCDSIQDTCPVGAFLSYPLSGADPRKVVLSRANIRLMKGQHLALSGRGCPLSECFVQVHHFKWVTGLIEMLKKRAVALRRDGHPQASESSRIVHYFGTHNGAIDLADDRFLVGDGRGNYPFWPLIRRWTTLRDTVFAFGEAIRQGPLHLESADVRRRISEFSDQIRQFCEPVANSKT